MEKNAKSTRGALVALGIILALGLGLHLYRISYPDRSVFDEAHFATYAADYVKDQIFFDIHPPLGKLIYAAAIPLVHPGPLDDTTFIGFTHSATGTVYYPTNIPYGSFPYIPLRLVGVFFGLLLTGAFYFFLRNIGVSEVGALLGAFFVTLDNAILLETKLILMNGIYLAFGFIALALWFSKSRTGTVAAGFFLGLSLGVKLIGIVFLGPILIDAFINKRKILKFLITVMIVFLMIASLNFLFFSPQAILSFSKSIGMEFPAINTTRANDLFAVAASTIIPWTEYVIGGPQPQTSPWYGWPFMRGTMTYYEGATSKNNLILKGNPAIWYASTVAILIGFIYLLYYLYLFLRRRFQQENSLIAQPPFSILLVGYFFSLLPFFTFVRRGTFIYHYFPALLFAIGFLAWGISHWLKLETLDSLTQKQWLWLGGITAITVAGFILTAPFTYGI